MKAANELFPDSPRVIYAKAPLTEVVCQLRFPPLLRIESTPPADFQERIRAVFPLLERRPQLQLGLPQGLPPEIMQIIGSASAGANYVFRTEKQDFTLTLAPDWLALSTTKYERWEGFKSLLLPPLDALIDIYKPSFFSRIGLRYQNAIRRSILKVEDQAWVKLLEPHILGALALPHFEPHILEVRKVIRAKFPDGAGSMLLQHGFGGNDAHDRNVYLLDFDLYAEKTEVKNAVSLLNDFHARAGRAFRWCITRFLHEHLGPSQLDEDSANVRTANF
jgi:uncharacterized protein (TIGR04255 family)